MQVPAPAAGVIEVLLVPDGGKVEGGTPLFKLRKTGGKSEACKESVAALVHLLQRPDSEMSTLVLNQGMMDLENSVW